MFNLVIDHRPTDIDKALNAKGFTWNWYTIIVDWEDVCRKTWTLAHRSLCTWLEEETHYLTDCNIKSAKVFVSQSRHILVPWIIAELIGRGNLKYHGFLYVWGTLKLGQWHAPSLMKATWRRKENRLVRPSEGKCMVFLYEILWSKVKQWLNLMWMVQKR